MSKGTLDVKDQDGTVHSCFGVPTANLSHVSLDLAAHDETLERGVIEFRDPETGEVLARFDPIET